MPLLGLYVAVFDDLCAFLFLSNWKIFSTLLMQCCEALVGILAFSQNGRTWSMTSFAADRTGCLSVMWKWRKRPNTKNIQSKNTYSAVSK